MNRWVSLTHVLHKKNPFDLFLTINESLALKGLLTVSVCFLRQSIAQALWRRQVVWGVRKKNPLSSLTIRDFLCCKGSPIISHSLSPVTGMHGCPNQTQLATGSQQVKILRKPSRDLWIRKEKECEKWVCTSPLSIPAPRVCAQPCFSCDAGSSFWLVCKLPVTFCCRMVLPM